MLGNPRRYYSDVSDTDGNDAAAQHYLSDGRQRHRVTRRLRVILSYEEAAGIGGDKKSLFGGLCNQIYSHVGMLALALQMGAEVVSMLCAVAARSHEGSSAAYTAVLFAWRRALHLQLGCTRHCMGIVYTLSHRVLDSARPC